MSDLHVQTLEAKPSRNVHGKFENHLRGMHAEDNKILHERRDMIEILLSILEITNEPIKKTHILYSAKINFYQLTKYLDLLLKISMIEEVKYPFEGYKITEKGRILLNLFAQSAK